MGVADLDVVQRRGVESHGISHGGFVAVRRRSVRKRHRCAKSNRPGTEQEQTNKNQIDLLWCYVSP